MKKIPFLLVGIILLGAALRVIAAVSNGRFWFDEIMTVEIASRPWMEMWQYLKVENHPPLHYVIVHVWMRLFGDGEVVIKLSSVLAGVLGIVATFILGKRLFGGRAGLWAALLTAVSTFHLYYSAEARMYPWLYLFGALSLLAFWELVQRDRLWMRLAWAAATLAALYTHLGAVFLIIVEGIFFAFINVGANNIRPQGENNIFPYKFSWNKFILYVMGIVAAWSPWLFVFIQEKLQTFNRNAWYFWVEVKRPFPIEAAKRFFLFDSYAEYLNFFGWIVIAAAFAAAFVTVSLHQRGAWEARLSWDRATLFAVLIFLLPIMLGFLAHVWFMKLYTVATLGAYVLAGKGLSRLNLPKGAPSSLLPILVSVLFVSSSIGLFTDVRPAWKEVGGYLEGREGEADAIIILSHSYEVALRYYYKGAMPVLPFYPLAADKGDTLMRAVRRNWYTLLTGENIDYLEELTRGKDRLFLVVVGNFYDVERVGLEWFFRQGWKLKSVRRWQDYMVNPEVYLLEAPEPMRINE